MGPSLRPPSRQNTAVPSTGKPANRSVCNPMITGRSTPMAERALLKLAFLDETWSVCGAGKVGPRSFIQDETGRKLANVLQATGTC